MQWRNWTDLGGNLQGTPAIAGWTTRFVDVALRTKSGNVVVGWRDENGWGGLWQDVGLQGAEEPAIVRVRDSLYVFARGSDNHLWVGGSISARDLGGDVQSAPSIAQWRLDGYAHVFFSDSNGAVQHVTWSPGISGHWESIGGNIIGAPAAVAWGPNRIDVVAQSGTTLHLVHCKWDGTTWSSWQDLGGSNLQSSPCVVSRDIGQLEVFYADSTGQLTTRSFNGAQWSAPIHLGPQIVSTPAAFSFGPTHVEVLQTTVPGSLTRVYQESARPGDDPSSSPLAAGPFASAPSCFGAATTTMHCLAQGVNGGLQHIVYEDGFWGAWGELDASVPIVGNPAIASPFPGVLDIAVSTKYSVLLRRLTNRTWSSWINTATQTNDEIAVMTVANETRFLVRTTGNRLFEYVVAVDGTWSVNDLGGTITSRPHIVEIAADLLPKPAGAQSPNVAVAAGPYLCALGSGGTTLVRTFGSGGWSTPMPFADGAAKIRRPLNVSWPLGFPVIKAGDPVSTASQTGWIGRTASGDTEATAMWWEEKVIPHYVSSTQLVVTPWTSLPPSVASDPVGLTMLESLDGVSPPSEPTLWMFARMDDGLVLHTRIQQLAPTPHSLDWEFFAIPADGDPALLILWERYEDAALFHVVIVTDDGRLLATRGGTDPEPSRFKPQPSSAGGLHPRPRMIHR